MVKKVRGRRVVHVAGDVAAAASAQRRTAIVMRCGKVAGPGRIGAMMAQEARAAVMRAAGEVASA